MATCKYCGCGNLMWKLVDGKWKLFKDDEVHVCHQTQQEYYDSVDRASKRLKEDQQNKHWSDWSI